MTHLNIEVKVDHLIHKAIISRGKVTSDTLDKMVCFYLETEIKTGKDGCIKTEGEILVNNVIYDYKVKLLSVKQ